MEVIVRDFISVCLLVVIGSATSVIVSFCIRAIKKSLEDIFE